MDARYPFKFLDAYRQQDAEFFFGRDEEIASLYTMLYQGSIILVYGFSGTGKTSLIQCGLSKRFQPHDWLPIYIRRGQNLNQSLEKALADAGGREGDEGFDMGLLMDAFSEEKGLENTDQTQSALARQIRQLYLRSLRPIYLIFDQFEELYILGTRDEQQGFIQRIRDILETEHPVRIIFSMREEYLGYLYEFERQVPQLMRKKLRVEPMNLDRVRQVIRGATRKGASIIHLKKGQEDQLAERIFEKIRGEGSQKLTIELPYLQVFLDRFYLQVTGDEDRKAEAEFSLEQLDQMGAIEDVLKDFLEEQAKIIYEEQRQAFPQIEPETIWKLLSPFATLDGTKEPIAIDKLYQRFPDLDPGFVKATLQSLEGARILKVVDENMELSHDSLANVINQKRSLEERQIIELERMLRNKYLNSQKGEKDYLTPRQLIELEPLEEEVLRQVRLDDQQGVMAFIEESRQFRKAEEQAELVRREKELENERKARRRQRIILILVSFTAVVIAGMGIFAWDAKREAQQKNLLLVEESFEREIGYAIGQRGNMNYNSALDYLAAARRFTLGMAARTNLVDSLDEQLRTLEELVPLTNQLFDSLSTLSSGVMSEGQLIGLRTVLNNYETAGNLTQGDQVVQERIQAAAEEINDRFDYYVEIGDFARSNGANVAACEAYRKAGLLIPDNPGIQNKISSCQ